MKSLSPDSRSLIDEVRAKDAPPRGAELRNWQSLASKLNAPLPPTAAAAHAALSTQAATHAANGIFAGITGKVVVGVAIAAASVGAGVYASREWGRVAQPSGVPSSVAARQPSAAASNAAAQAEPPPAANAEGDGVAPPAKPLPSGQSMQPASEQPAASGLRAEAQLIERAQKALAAGKPVRALALLAQHRDRFPNGALTEERAAARILALCALGRSVEAAKEREAFEVRWPTSMLAARVRAACAEPR